MQTPTLLPCPFCGATDDDNDLRRVIGYEYQNVWIECDKCGAQGPHVTIKTLPRGVSTEDFIKAKRLVEAEASAAAAAAWNQRSAWQPIETAPRDGTTVLLWNGSKPDGDQMAVGFIAPGWRLAEIWGATHWQPLPSPPPITPSAPHVSIEGQSVTVEGIQGPHAHLNGTYAVDSVNSDTITP
jgi:Lar family restriction alleviation protein